MPTVVQYEIVKELARTAVVQVCRVKTADKADGSLVLKRCVPPDNGLVDRKAIVRSFLDKARAQQAAAASADSRWVKIHEVAENGDGAYFVSDYYAGSAHKLINGQVRLSPAALLALVRSVLDGLDQMRATSDRHHGNLKPTNVLIAATDEIEEADVFLCDPADGNDPAAHDGAAEDLFQVGQLIHQLVLHRPFRPVTGWPVEPSPAWSRLGHAGRRWREFCNHLLHPDALARPGSLAEARRELDRVARRPLTHTLAWATAAVLLVAGLGAGVMLYQRHARIQRDALALEAAYEGWFPQFDDVIQVAAFRQLAERDRHLSEQVLAPRLLAQHAGPDRTDVLRPSHVRDLYKNRPGVLDRERALELRYDLELVRQIGDGIKNWDFLARLAQHRTKYGERSWKEAEKYLAAQISEATPPSRNVGPTIDRLLEDRAALEASLAEVEKAWGEIESERATIRQRAAGSEVPPKFAEYLHDAAAACDVQVNEPADLKKLLKRLQNVLDGAREFAGDLPEGWAKEVDIEKLHAYEKQLPAKPSPTDFLAWRKRRWEYLPFPLPPDLLAELDKKIRDAGQAVEKLEALSHAPQVDAQAHADPAKLADYKRTLPGLATSRNKLAATRFLLVERDAAMKSLHELDRTVDAYSAEVVNELARISPEPVGKWREAALAKFDGNEPLAQAWRQRLDRRVSDEMAARFANELGAYLDVRQKVAAWATEYGALPNRFPPAPDTGDAAFDSALRERRQAALRDALHLFDEADEPKFDDPRVAQLGQDYGQFVQNTQQVFAQCQAARQLLDAGGGVGAKGPNGLSLSDLETDLKARLAEYAGAGNPIGARIGGIIGEIAAQRDRDTRVAALEQEAEELRQNDDLPAALDRYKQISGLRRGNHDAEAKYQELAAEIAKRVQALLDRAGEQAKANDLDAATATLADLDRLSPGNPKAAELLRELGRRKEEIERGKGVELHLQQARALLREGKPNAALDLLANDQGADVTQLRKEIQALKLSSDQSARAADQYFAAQRYPLARELYEKAIAGGNAYAMFKLGLMLREGIGTGKQPNEARGWFLRAAAGNEPGAMRALAQGLSPKDANEWVQKLQSLAEANDPRALFHLGEMYRLNEGVKQDKSRAVTYYTRAANNGSGPAAYQLAVMFETGDGQQPSDARARFWYDKAAHLGNADAIQWLEAHPPEQRSAARPPPPQTQQPTQPPTRPKRNPWVKNPEFQ